MPETVAVLGPPRVLPCFDIRRVKFLSGRDDREGMSPLLPIAFFLLSSISWAQEQEEEEVMAPTAGDGGNNYRACHASGDIPTHHPVIANWQNLKDFIDAHRDSFGDLFLSDADRLARRFRFEGPVAIRWPYEKRRRESSYPRGSDRASFDTGSTELLLRCEGLGHLPWGQMVEKYLERPSSEAFGPAYNDKIGELLHKFSGSDALKGAMGSRDFEYVLFLTREGAEQLEANIHSVCLPEGQSVAQIIRAKFRGLIHGIFEEQMEELQSFGERTQMCEAALGLTKWSDFDNEDRGTKEAQSFDRRIRCRGFKNDTQDFPRCQSAANFYNVSVVSDHALRKVQGIRHQGKMLDGQRELSRGGAFNHTGALEYQKEGIESMKDIAQQRAAFDSIKLAKFLEIIKRMPTHDSLLSSCRERYDKGVNRHLQSLFEGAVDRYREKMASFFIPPLMEGGQGAFDFDGLKSQGLPSSESEVICTMAIDGESVLLLNQKARDVARQMAMKAAVDLGVNLAQAQVLGKQADNLDGLIESVKSHDPSKVVTINDDALMVEECRLNPALPQCQKAKGASFQNISLPDSSISLSIGGGERESKALGAEDDEGVDEATGGNRSFRQGGRGNIAPLPKGLRKGGGRPRGGRAAKLKQGGGGGAGGGGGGGGSAGGGGGGGGGGTGGGGGPRRKRPHRAQESKVAYKNTGSGSLASFFKRKGGKGARKKKRETDANPFSKLFKKKGPKNDTLAFPTKAIGKRDKSLWVRLSASYKTVDASGRLLKYEMI